MLLAALASGGIGTALVLAILIVAEVIFDGRIPALKVDPKGVRLHPALVIVALPTGAALGGIPGMIIAVPTVAVAVALAGTVIEVLSGLPRGAPRVTVEGDVPIWLDRAAQWSWRLLVGAGLAAIAIGLASLVPSIIAPVLVAVTLAATFLPATRALESRGWSRTRAAGTISVVLWVVVGVVTVQSIAALAGPIGQALSAAAAGSDKLGAALAPGVSGAPTRHRLRRRRVDPGGRQHDHRIDPRGLDLPGPVRAAGLLHAQGRRPCVGRRDLEAERLAGARRSTSPTQRVASARSSAAT